MFERIGGFFRKVFGAPRVRAVGEAVEDAAAVAVGVALRAAVDQRLAELVSSVNRNRRLSDTDKAVLVAAIRGVVEVSLRVPTTPSAPPEGQ